MCALDRRRGRPNQRSIRLRTYQRRAAKATLEAFRYRPRVLLALPTGAGKTVIAAHLITGWARAGGRVLFLAHRREIIEQTVETLVTYGVPVDLISVIRQKDRREDLSLPIQVASVQTLWRRRDLPAIDVVVIDEAHHAVSQANMALLAKFPRAKILGLTATPFRTDGKGLGDVFEDLIVGAKPSELVRRGYLSSSKIWSQPREQREKLQADLKKVRTVGGDYERRELARVVNRPKLVGDIVEHWKRLSANRPTVVYAVNLAHARRIQRAFSRAGIRMGMVRGDNHEAERRDMLAELASGKLAGIVNCMILTEGWDCPVVKCIVLARPTKSIQLYLQMLGRGLRPGKELVVLDHAGVAHRFGFPHFDREMTLAGMEKVGKGATPCKVCPNCDATVPAGVAACTECGHLFDAQQALTEQDGELRQLDPIAVQHRMNALRKSAATIGIPVCTLEELARRARDAAGV